MRFSCVRQHDASDCGAAALATVALHHRRPLALERARDLAGTDGVGTSLLALQRAAERLGFSARGAKGAYGDLAGVPLPAIAHVTTDVGQGHFVVLHRVRTSGVVVADPARGVLELSRQDFTRRWTGFVLLLTPESPSTESKPASPWSRFVGLIRPHRGMFAEAFACAILMTVLGLGSALFVRHLVDTVLVRGERPLLDAFAVGMLAVLAFRTFFGLLRQYLLIHIGRRIDLALVGGYARHVLRLPLAFFEMRRVGEILSRVNDAARVRAAVGGTVLTTLVDGTLVVVSMAAMFLCDSSLALVATLFAPLVVGGILLHLPATVRRSREAMENGARLQAHLVEDVSSVETVKAFGLEGARAAQAERSLVRVVGSATALQHLGMSIGAVSAVLAGAAGVAVLWYGGHRVIDGALTIGQLMFFATLLGNLLSPLERLASVNLQLQEALVAVDRLYQILDLEGERVDERGRAEFKGLRDGVELRGVSFRYGGRPDVLRDVSLRIPAGRTVAIVGESGSGKTTLLKLLMRFHDPSGGRVTIDGLDAGDYATSSLRRRIGLVSQDPWIFSGTVRDNIAVARPDAPLEAVAEAARLAGLAEFINALPNRYDTRIGERGTTISGGQRQRVALARAFLLDPEILLLDEATSHLDAATERAILAGLRDAWRGRTILMVAHRLSTIRQADTICVLDRGRIVEQGTHGDLLARDGRFAELYRAQVGSAEPCGIGIAA